MHEMAIVNNLLDECERLRLANKASKISRIKVSLGRLCGVEEHYFKEAFKAFSSDTKMSYHGAKLEIEHKDLVLFCKHCSAQFIQDKNEFYCKFCASKNVQILSGEELVLEQLELE